MLCVSKWLQQHWIQHAEDPHTRLLLCLFGHGQQCTHLQWQQANAISWALEQTLSNLGLSGVLRGGW